MIAIFSVVDGSLQESGFSTALMWLLALPHWASFPTLFFSVTCRRSFHLRLNFSFFLLIFFGQYSSLSVFAIHILNARRASSRSIMVMGLRRRSKGVAISL